MTPNREWHRAQVVEVLTELGTSEERGLTVEEVARRTAEVGPNELAEGGARSVWLILWEQLSALMMVLLLAAAVISALLGDYKDAAVISAIVVLNALLGFSQEYRAEQAMAALKKLSVPMTRVRRDGEVREVSSRELVPGDIVFLEAGNFVAADGRLIENAALHAQEAALTGESEPVEKLTHPLDPADLPLGDRKNMVYRGTSVTMGRGVAVVTETGMRTQLGRIASMLQSVAPEVTPLQRRLAQLGKVLATVALAIVAVIFAIGVMRGEDLKLMFLTAVSIGVAAVPEGLPAVVTIALTLGAQRMLRRRVLVRRLSSVETLGSVTTICSDKTGTLTENRMTATVIALPGGRMIEIPRAGFHQADSDAVELLLRGAALCNDAVIRTGAGSELGDPTEIALAVAAQRYGLVKESLDEQYPRTDEIGFDSVRKRMTTVHAVAPGSRRVAFTKGAVDGLLEVSSDVWIEGAAVPMDDARRRRIADLNDSLAAQGKRVLGFAFRELEDGEEVREAGLTWIGMIGMLDPPRADAPAAVEKCKSAGIRPIMITGDHPMTARAIAVQLGIPEESVHARVSPEQKLGIVDGLQKRDGEIVAMTGDGVNDAPALKKADIGIAMGITGTDVAKEAADMVLLDDNFATIVAAVEEGRVIYDNVRKFIKYILATNSGEIWVMLVAPLMGMPLPLLPLQILWMNLVTDGLPALALGIEPAEEDVMQRPPRAPNEHVFARGLGRHVLWVGLLMGVLCLGVGYWSWKSGDPHWQTMLFTTLTFSQMGHVLAIRSERQSLFHIGVLSNAYLAGAVALTVLLQFALVYVTELQDLFGTKALPAADLTLTLAASCVVFVAVELEKWFARRRAGG